MSVTPLYIVIGNRAFHLFSNGTLHEQVLWSGDHNGLVQFLIGTNGYVVLGQETALQLAILAFKDRPTSTPLLYIVIGENAFNLSEKNFEKLELDLNHDELIAFFIRGECGILARESSVQLVILREVETGLVMTLQ